MFQALSFDEDDVEGISFDVSVVIKEAAPQIERKDAWIST